MDEDFRPGFIRHDESEAPLVIEELDAAGRHFASVQRPRRVMDTSVRPAHAATTRPMLPADTDPHGRAAAHATPARAAWLVRLRAREVCQEANPNDSDGGGEAHCDQ